MHHPHFTALDTIVTVTVTKKIQIWVWLSDDGCDSDTLNQDQVESWKRY